MRETPKGIFTRLGVKNFDYIMHVDYIGVFIDQIISAEDGTAKQIFSYTINTCYLNKEITDVNFWRHDRIIDSSENFIKISKEEVDKKINEYTMYAVLSK